MFNAGSNPVADSTNIGDPGHEFEPTCSRPGTLTSCGGETPSVPTTFGHNMSSPTYTTFWYNGTIKHQYVCNIGWFSDAQQLGQCLVDALTDYHNHHMYDDFDFVRIHDYEFDILDLIEWKHGDITFGTLLDKADKLHRNHHN